MKFHCGRVSAREAVRCSVWEGESEAADAHLSMPGAATSALYDERSSTAAACCPQPPRQTTRLATDHPCPLPHHPGARPAIIITQIPLKDDDICIMNINQFRRMT